MDIRNKLFESAVRGDSAGMAQAATEDLRAKFSLEEDHGYFFEGLTLLMVAAGSPWGNLETVRTMVNLGAETSALSAGEVTAAWYAASGIPGPLLDKSLPRNSETNWFRSHGSADVLEYLLGLGSDPNETASYGRSLLSEACKAGNVDSVLLLLSSGVDPIAGSPTPPQGPTVLDVAESSMGPVVKQVIERMREDHESRLAQSNPVAAELQLNLNAFAIPLHQAAESGSADCVRALLDAGVPGDLRDEQWQNALAHASSAEIVNLLLAAGANPSVPSMSGDIVDDLFEAANYEAARALLLGGAPLEQASQSRSRAHNLAGVRMDVEALKVFMECGGDIHTPSYEGGTILHTACWQGQYSENTDRPPAVTRAMMEFLVGQGIDLDPIDNRGQSALHEAIQGDWECPIAVEVLLAHGANPNLRNRSGQTPLMLAAHGLPDCVEPLLKYGADPALNDPSGKAALDYALDAVRSSSEGGMFRKAARKFAGKQLQKLIPNSTFDLEASDAKRHRKAAQCAHMISQAMLDRGD